MNIDALLDKISKRQILAIAYMMTASTMELPALIATGAVAVVVIASYTILSWKYGPPQEPVDK